MDAFGTTRRGILMPSGSRAHLTAQVTRARTSLRRSMRATIIFFTYPHIDLLTQLNPQVRIQGGGP